MGLKITDRPSVSDILLELDDYDEVQYNQYGCCVDLFKLVVEHECHNIVELHSPHSRVGCTLCKAFEDITVKSVCNPHEPHNHADNLTCIEDWSDNVVDTIPDESLDMVFIHDHDIPYDDLSSTLSAWLRKLKPGGVMCGRHFGLMTDMSTQARALYDFIDRESLVLDSQSAHMFVVLNEVVIEPQNKSPIRMEDLNE